MIKKDKYKAILIGCGNIGAGYDFDDNTVRTHAKAYAMCSRIELGIYDQDSDLSSRIAGKYGCKQIIELNTEELKSADVVSICTPTHTHFNYLETLLELNCPLVISEKPVSNSISELNSLTILYSTSNSQVLVNYPRRFHKTFHELKKKIASIISEEPLQQVIVKYQRGFFNNGSHAWDLIAFLLDQEIKPQDIKVDAMAYDSFQDDPTLSCSFFTNDILIQFIGFMNISFSYWEITFVFKDSLLEILEGGNTINYYRSKGYALPQLEDTLTGTYSDFMEHVIHEALSILDGSKNDDNFNASVKMSLSMLSLIKQAKS